MKGIFISFEGIEGTGKSTQARLLCEWLRGKGFDVILTEEPGGTRIGLKIRETLLSIDHKDMTPITELLLYNASRAQHVSEVIRRAIVEGSIVITDRFTDSTMAYQGYGRGIDFALVGALDRIATDSMRPDITILLDLDAEVGLKRNRGINKTDRIEMEDVAFHQRVRSGYLDLAAKEPDRIILIDTSLPIKEVHKRIITVIGDFINSRNGAKGHHRTG
jgi:dTMP kinase